MENRESIKLSGTNSLMRVEKRKEELSLFNSQSGKIFCSGLFSKEDFSLPHLEAVDAQGILFFSSEMKFSLRKSQWNTDLPYGRLYEIKI